MGRGGYPRATRFSKAPRLTPTASTCFFSSFNALPMIGPRRGA